MRKQKLLLLLLAILPLAAMAHKKESNKKPHVTIATIGKVDCGKTTLTAAITLVLSQKGFGNKIYMFDEIDCSPEERERGISIDPTTIEYETAGVRYTHIDCPGHEDYLDRTERVLDDVDGAILVIPARDDEWLPKTERIMAIARKAKVKKLVVFINHMDLLGFVNHFGELVLDEEKVSKLESDMRVMLKKYRYSAHTPIIKGSALGALNGVEKYTATVQSLLDACDQWLGNVNQPNGILYKDNF